MQKRKDYSLIKLTPDICEFLGAFIGDGYIGPSTLGICGHQVLDREYLIYLESIVRENFGVVGHFTNIRGCNGAVLRFYSKSLCEYVQLKLNLIPNTSKTHSIFVPLEISDNLELFLRTIRGIFDTDGCVYLDRRPAYRSLYPRIVLRTASRPLYDQVRLFLGNYFSLYCQVSLHGPFVSHEVVIYGRKQVEKWVELIGFSNERHLSKIRRFREPSARFERATTSLFANNLDTKLVQ